MPGREPTVSALITAEHASNHVPPAYRALFAGAEDILASHRAWDPGSKQLAQALSQHLDLPLLKGKVTRLLVDLNRSASHPRCLSEFSRRLSPGERQTLMASYWRPYWQAYAETVQQLPGQVVHIACHSFTPVLDGVVRKADIGLLYDPARAAESQWCLGLKAAIVEQLPEMRVRMNYPYRGTSNGLGQQHRKVFDDSKLITMELELSAALVEDKRWGRVRGRLVKAVASALLQAAGNR